MQKQAGLSYKLEYQPDIPAVTVFKLVNKLFSDPVITAITVLLRSKYGIKTM